MTGAPADPPAPPGGERRKLATVEAGRGLAALAVVAFHANASARYLGQDTYPLLSLGEHGVDFFFVLSGFIICFVHGRDVGQPSRAWAYLRKRLIRVYPTLWLTVSLCAIALIVRGDPPDGATLGTSMLLYPSEVAPLPLVVWTLRHEAVFYVAFLVLIVNRRAGLTLAVAAVALSIGQMVLSWLGRPVGGLGAFFLSPFHLDFALGAGVALAHRRHAFQASLLPLAFGFGLVVLALAIEHNTGLHREGLLDYTSIAATTWTVVLGLAFAALLHGLLCAEPIVRVPAPLIWLGAWSYALYLVHTPVNSLVQHLVAPTGQGWTHIILIAAGLAASAGVYMLFERPLSAFLANRQQRRRVALSVPSRDKS